MDYVGRVWQDILPHVQESIELGDFEIMVNQYWKHRTSGEIFAVQHENHDIVSACGPLEWREVTEANLSPWNFNSDPEVVDALGGHLNDYRTVLDSELEEAGLLVEAPVMKCKIFYGRNREHLQNAVNHWLEVNPVRLERFQFSSVKLDDDMEHIIDHTLVLFYVPMQ